MGVLPVSVRANLVTRMGKRGSNPLRTLHYSVSTLPVARLASLPCTSRYPKGVRTYKRSFRVATKVKATV